METKLKESGKNLLIANAGKDGQSTHGHIKNFELWFPEIENLKPKYVLFYVGINDYFAAQESSFDVMGRDHLSRFQLLKAKIKDNSVTYGLLRKLRGIYKVKNINLGHDKIDFSKFKYDSFPRIAAHREEEYDSKNLVPFRARLKVLLSYVNKMGAKSVLITQPTAHYKLINGQVYGVEQGVFDGINGVDYYFFLNKLNDVIRDVCKDHCQVIELTSLPIWEEDDYYDWFHMTPKGTEKVAEEIFKQFKDSLK